MAQCSSNFSEDEDLRQIFSITSGTGFCISTLFIDDLECKQARYVQILDLTPPLSESVFSSDKKKETATFQPLLFLLGIAQAKRQLSFGFRTI
jgi:hypothetical protein